MPKFEVKGESENLKELNRLRRRASMVELTLEPQNVVERINKLREKFGEKKLSETKNHNTSAEVRKINEPKAKKVAPPPRKTPVKKPAPPPTAEELKSGVRLGHICKRLKIEPKAARIRLRAADASGRVPPTVGDAWVWLPKHVPAVEAIIEGSKK